MEDTSYSIKLKLNKLFSESLNNLRKKYGPEFEKLNGFANQNLNFTDFIDNFIDTKTAADATIDPNANSSSKDICALLFEMKKPHMKLLSFHKVYYELIKKFGLETADNWLEAEWNGSFYLHDAYDVSFKPYCFAFDCDSLAEKGLHFVNNFGSGAPKHYTTFIRDVIEFVSWNSNRISGAVGLPSLLVYMWYFWNKDVKEGYFTKDPDYYRDQGFQEIIYGLNHPACRVNQSAFTNVTIMDRPYLQEIFGGRIFPDGTMAIDHIEEILEFQKNFMKVVSEVRSERMFTFPVLTYSLLWDPKKHKFVDEEFARWCSDHNCLWNDANFFNSSDITSLSSCCRLVNDFSDLDGFINSIGGTALKIGSVKVNTINLMRIALEADGDKDKYIKILKERTILCIKVLEVIRNIIKRNIEKGLLPNYTHGLIDITKQFNTIGINGMYEAVKHTCGMDVDELGCITYSKEGLDFANKILDTLNEVKDAYKKANNTDYKNNIEAIPAERAAVILAKKDALLFHLEDGDKIYSNQWIPLTKKTPIQHKIMLGSILDSKCGGGQISHINLESNFNNKKMAWKMLNQIADAGVIYFAFNTKIKSCKNHHGWTTDSQNCPICGEPVNDTWQRVVGYLTPSSSYSKERKAEFSERYWFNLNDR